MTPSLNCWVLWLGGILSMVLRKEERAASTVSEVSTRSKSKPEMKFATTSSMRVSSGRMTSFQVPYNPEQALMVAIDTVPNFAKLRAQVTLYL